MFNYVNAFVSTKDNQVIIETKIIAKSNNEIMEYVENVLHVNTIGAFVSVDLSTKENVSEELRAEAQNLVNNIIDNGLELNGNVYVPLFAGAGDMRTASYVAIRQDLYDAVMQHIHWDIDTSKLSAAKESKYNALSTSVSYTWTAKFPEGGFMGLMKPIDINKVAVFKDIDVEVEKVFDTVDPEQENLVRQMVKKVNTVSDGLTFYVVDDTNVDVYKHLDKLESFSFRAPGFKGLMVVILKSSLRKLLKAQNHNGLVKDYCGNEVNLMDLQVISFKSCFKWSKCCDWTQYVKGFVEEHHEFRVCITAHNHKKADMPYQQLGMLNMTTAEVESYVKENSDVLKSYEDVENSDKLLNKDFANVCKILPAMRNHWYTKMQKQNAYASKRRKIAGGRMNRKVHNIFAAPDTYGVLTGLLGNHQSLIPEGSVVCSMYVENKTLGITRNPHLGIDYLVRKVVRTDWNGLFCGTTMFFSNVGVDMNVLQMDYDGDHVTVVDDDNMIEIMKRTLVETNYRCLLYGAMDDGRKDPSGKEAFHTLLKNIVPAPVGMYALSILMSRATKGFNLDEIGHLTRKANVCIDEVTHGADNCSQSIAEALSQFYMRGPEGSKKAPRRPIFHAYAKGKIAKDDVTVLFPKEAHKYTVYEDYILDQYCCGILFSTNEVLKQPEEEFDASYVVNALCVGKPHRIAGIGETTEVGKDGLWTSISMRRASEWKIVEDSNYETQANFRSEQTANVMRELQKFADERSLTLDEVIDGIITHVFHLNAFNKNAKCSHKQQLRTFWETLGEVVYDRLVKKFGDIEAYSEDDFDIDFDDDIVE